ncbi:hypothetical protein [Halobacillus halophilus]|uniref:hypothetical protein n=1 Tax=Halobacillus halophilus TaxID=1570 RepID=UPI0005A2C342|nr:hypothetical protein [Halobacillus halophilus]
MKKLEKTYYIGIRALLHFVRLNFCVDVKEKLLILEESVKLEVMVYDEGLLGHDLNSPVLRPSGKQEGELFPH